MLRKKKRIAENLISSMSDLFSKACKTQISSCIMRLFSKGAMPPESIPSGSARELSDYIASISIEEARGIFWYMLFGCNKDEIISLGLSWKEHYLRKLGEALRDSPYILDDVNNLFSLISEDLSPFLLK